MSRRRYTGVTDVLGYESFNYTFPANGTYYFYCPISNHCENGMQKTVTVLPKLSEPTKLLLQATTMILSTDGRNCSLGTYQDEERPAVRCQDM